MKIWIIEPHDACVTTRLKDQINRMGEEMGGSLPMASDDRIRREKRLFPRMPCFLLVDYATQGCAYRAFVRNISADGLFIESLRPDPAERPAFLYLLARRVFHAEGGFCQLRLPEQPAGKHEQEIHRVRPE